MNWFGTTDEVQICNYLNSINLVKRPPQFQVMDFGDIGNEFFVILEGKVKVLVPIDEEVVLKIPKLDQED